MKKVILIICIMAIAGISLGAIYKWVDDEGRVHYSDKPTDKHKTKEIDVEPAPSPEEMDKARKRAEKLKQRSIEEPAKETVDQSENENRLAQEQYCLEARQQLAILQEMHLPAYRDEQRKFRAKWKYDTYQGKREYLDDAMRDSAIEQAREKVAANCKHPDDAKEQELARKRWIRSEYCAKHRAELEALEQPSAHAVRQDLEKKRRLVKMYCGE
jgi:hypothetical protein